MSLKFNLQLFGSKTTTEQVRKRDPQPQELNTLAQGLFSKVYPGLQSFDSNSWNQAQKTAANALTQQGNLLSQIPGATSQSNNILSEMLNATKTGNIPTALSNNMNAAVNKGLQGSMGSMLNSLAGRGVLNSSITGQGINNLSQAAADAFNSNYLTAYNTVLGGYGQALQGAQNNTNSLLSALSAVGGIPSQAYEGAAAGITPAFNLWKTWQSLENSKPEEYDTIVKQKGWF